MTPCALKSFPALVSVAAFSLHSGSTPQPTEPPHHPCSSGPLPLLCLTLCTDPWGASSLHSKLITTEELSLPANSLLCSRLPYLSASCPDALQTSQPHQTCFSSWVPYLAENYNLLSGHQPVSSLLLSPTSKQSRRVKYHLYYAFLLFLTATVKFRPHAFLSRSLHGLLSVLSALSPQIHLLHCLQGSFQNTNLTVYLPC